MTVAAISSIVVFLVMFGLVITEKFEKHYVTLTCAGVMLIVVFGAIMRDGNAIADTLNFYSLVNPNFWIGETPDSSGIDWATIIFLGGMMIMVEGLSIAGFFRWLCMTLAKAVKYKKMPLFITFMIVATILSMFIDSITVILFLAAVTVEIAKLLDFNPVPMILSEIFCANLGGSATMCGDPPNIIIGSKLHYSFMDFVMNTGMIAGICLIVIIFYFYLVYRKEFNKPGKEIDIENMPHPTAAITSKFLFAGNTVIFACAIAMLVTHANTHLSVAFIGATVALATCILNCKHLKEIFSKVDYKILLFFIGLFVVVGGLEKTGILAAIASFISRVSGGNVKTMIAIVIWVSAIASAFVDNIPFAATMVPIVKGLSVGNPALQATLAWTLSIGTDIGGAATPIGASANVVGTAVAGRNGYPIGWGKYCKTAVPATIIVVVMSMLIIYLRYC